MRRRHQWTIYRWRSLMVLLSSDLRRAQVPGPTLPLSDPRSSYSPSWSHVARSSQLGDPTDKMNAWCSIADQGATYVCPLSREVIRRAVLRADATRQIPIRQVCRLYTSLRDVAQDCRSVALARR
ncbi:hypothetical protein C8T65DRAFT_667319 [Cerioporus squamosus]|nr:hypothetical protein C8T65DRAFT_667319 [Cerioporus squamosus]